MEEVKLIEEGDGWWGYLDRGKSIYLDTPEKKEAFQKDMEEMKEKHPKGY